MNAAIYIRKSREEKDKPSHRLTVQREQLPAHAIAQGWYTTIYDDGHASAARGKTEHLPERARLEADIRAGKINVILCIELSRLSRDESMQDYISWLTICADHRVKLSTMSRILDPSHHSDWMLLLMEGGFSSVEMKVLQGRMKEGRDEAYKTGKFLGGGCPPPYILDKTQGRPVADPELLRQMHHIWTSAETMSARAISQDTGRPEIFIRRALADDRLLYYQALRTDQITGEHIPCDWTPVMDAEQAKRIKAARGIRRNSTKGQRTHEPSLLSNIQIMYCGYCQRTIKTWHNTKGRTDGTRLNYYGCASKDTRLKCDRARLVAQDAVNFAVVTNTFNTLSNLEELKHNWELHQERMNTTDELQKTVDDIQRQQDRKKRLISAITQGVLELSDAKEAMEEIKIKIEQLEQHQQHISTNIIDPPDWDNINLTREEFSTLDRKQQREFLPLFIERIDIFNMHAIITYKFPRKPDGTATAKINLPETHRGQRKDK